MNDFKLDNHPKIDPGFKIPENYFEVFSERMMEQLPEREVKVVSIFSERKSWIYTVAAVLVLALSIPVLNRLSPTVNAPDQAALETYLTSHSEISNDDIVELLENEDIQKIKVDYDLEDKTIEDALSSNPNLENIIN